MGCEGVSFGVIIEPLFDSRYMTTGPDQQTKRTGEETSGVGYIYGTEAGGLVGGVFYTRQLTQHMDYYAAVFDDRSGTVRAATAPIDPLVYSQGNPLTYQTEVPKGGWPENWPVSGGSRPRQPTVPISYVAQAETQIFEASRQPNPVEGVNPIVPVASLRNLLAKVMGGLVQPDVYRAIARVMTGLTLISIAGHIYMTKPIVTPVVMPIQVFSTYATDMVDNHRPTIPPEYYPDRSLVGDERFFATAWQYSGGTIPSWFQAFGGNLIIRRSSLENKYFEVNNAPDSATLTLNPELLKFIPVGAYDEIYSATHNARVFSDGLPVPNYGTLETLTIKRVDGRVTIVSRYQDGEITVTDYNPDVVGGQVAYRASNGNVVRPGQFSSNIYAMVVQGEDGPVELTFSLKGWNSGSRDNIFSANGSE